jgi:UDP-N-acetylglucosamine--N-acetylmuramyl-(pentapeptide) pyrophosphoryl-undecaprenol N-acetylglucosamine transferase
VAESDHLFALIAGGGSGGHVLPGLAVAEALVARGHDRASIGFVGSTRGMEARLVPAAGFTPTLFDMTSFPRRLTKRHLVAFAQLGKALVQGLALVRRKRPSVVVSVGGYASLPGVVAAIVTRTPMVVVSYDAIPGRASLLAGRFAKKCAVAFDASPLPRQVVTGAAIRDQILAVNRAADHDAACAKLGLPNNRLTLLVVGGSQGSGALNDTIDAFVAANRHRSDVAIRHVRGSRFNDGKHPDLNGSDGLIYKPVGYEEDMASAYAAADVLLARSGATTVFEVAAVGLASILVPWPDATDDHQTANANALGKVGGAIVIRESEFSPDRLQAELAKLADPAVRQAIAAAATTVGHRDGAARIAAVVEDCSAS